MPTLLQEAYSPEAFRRFGHELIDLLADHLAAAQQAQGQVIPWQEPEQSLAYWQQDFLEPTLESPTSLFRQVLEHSTQLHHRRFMGHQVSAPAPVAALSGLLVSMLNNGMAVYEMGMASNPIEKIVTDWLARHIGFDEQSSGLLTSGGTLANLTALLAARALQAPEDVWEEGAHTQLAVMVSEEAHYCIDRAARIMGLGAKGIIKVPVNERFQMKTELLPSLKKQAEAEGYTVFCVVGSACSTSTGAYDDIEAIADFCAAHGLWLHIDGAHGGAVVCSEKYRSLVKGIERADSVVIDFHKMLLTPALNTALVMQRNDDAYQTFHQKAQYLWANQASHDWFNSGKRTFECTKLMMCVNVYVLLRLYGEAIFAQQIDSRYDLARDFAKLLHQHPNFELAVEPESNIVCFRYMKQDTDLNQLNAQIRRSLLQKGEFYIVQTTLHDQLYLRVSLMNPHTTLADLEALLAEILLIVA
ncbi:MAG: pyridoxal-dependent decarboxylase [Spirosomataceae bacterium]